MEVGRLQQSVIVHDLQENGPANAKLGGYPMGWRVGLPEAKHRGILLLDRLAGPPDAATVPGLQVIGSVPQVVGDFLFLALGQRPTKGQGIRQLPQTLHGVLRRPNAFSWQHGPPCYHDDRQP